MDVTFETVFHTLLAVIVSFAMKTQVGRWFLFEYKHGRLVILSKPFVTKEAAERVRLKFSERERRKIGIGRS